MNGADSEPRRQLPTTAAREMTASQYFVYFIVLLLLYCLWGVFYGAHCANARAQGQLPRGPIFEFIFNCTCYAGWRGTELLLIGELFLCDPAVCDSFMLAIQCPLVGFVAVYYCNFSWIVVGNFGYEYRL